MNEQLQNSVAEVVDLSKNGIIKGLTIAEREIPELINQILSFGLVSHLCLFLIGVVSILVCMKLVFNFRKYIISDDYDEYDTGKIVLYVLPIDITGIAGIAFFSENMMPLIKVIFAPKLYLLDYLKQLL